MALPNERTRLSVPECRKLAPARLDAATDEAVTSLRDSLFDLAALILDADSEMTQTVFAEARLRELAALNPTDEEIEAFVERVCGYKIDLTDDPDTGVIFDPAED